MSNEPQLFRVDPESRQSDRIEEVDFGRLGLRERRDIQEWVAANPGILDDDLLIIGKEFSGFDRTDERLDLLAVDYDGRLVVIELKRDDSGTDAHWQAIKYASYFQRATADVIVGMAASYWSESQENAVTRLQQHLGSDDLNALNNDQRIILASHRFAPEVTSAALWLNQKVPTEDLITCVKLTPYQDGQTNALYIQASTIIPVPGIDDYLVGVGHTSQLGPGKNGSNFADKLAATFAQSRNHETTPFVQKVGELALSGLPDEIRPDKTGRWAGVGGDRRYYHIWYSRPPWGNWKVNYSIDLWPQEESGKWRANVLFENRRKLTLPGLDGINFNAEQEIAPHGIYTIVRTGPDTLNDNFAKQIAEILREFIVQITPIVDDFGNESSEDDEA